MQTVKTKRYIWYIDKCKNKKKSNFFVRFFNNFFNKKNKNFILKTKDGEVWCISYEKS